MLHQHMSVTFSKAVRGLSSAKKMTEWLKRYNTHLKMCLYEAN